MRKVLTKRPLRIGIICTTHLTEEYNKDELLVCKSKKRPWLKDVAAVHRISDEDGRQCTSDDYAIGYYIRWAYQSDDVQVEFLNPYTMTPANLAKNDLNFIIIYDRLEAFHTESKKRLSSFVSVLKKATNVFPSFEYQTFINHKSIYYRHLKAHGIPVIPFFSVTKEQFHAAPDKMTDSVIGKARREKWGSFIAKPDFGQEGIDFIKFHKNASRERIYAFMESTLDRYPGLVFQKYIPGFDSSETKEFRVFFVGGQYAYTIVTAKTITKNYIPVSEGGTFVTPLLNAVHSLAKRVLTILPPIKINGVVLPQFLTRIDIAAVSKSQLLVNEVEFCPSLFATDTKAPIDALLGDNAVKLTHRYLTSRAAKISHLVKNTTKKKYHATTPKISHIGKNTTTKTSK